MATASAKRDEEGLIAAAKARGIRLIFVDQADLEIASARGATWSRRVLALAGVPSVAEAAALAAAGSKARLILPRIVVGPVTCALASDEGSP
jgi:cobalt-precorrin 5A hydrolase